MGRNYSDILVHLHVPCLLFYDRPCRRTIGGRLGNKEPSNDCYVNLYIRTGIWCVLRTYLQCTSVLNMSYLAIGPLFIGPLSELYGRVHVLQIANLFYLGKLLLSRSLVHYLPILTTSIVWNLACGFAQSETQLIIFRFLAGIGGSAPLSVSLHFSYIDSLNEWLTYISLDWWGCPWGLLAPRRTRKGYCNLLPRSPPWPRYWSHRWCLVRATSTVMYDVNTDLASGG
jgi:hypothetical protein